MPRIHALQIHPVMEGVDVWKLDTVSIPLERALMREYVGIGDPLEVDLGFGHRRGRRKGPELGLARLDLEGFDSFQGAVVARSATRLVRYLLQAARPTRGTALATWLAGRSLDEASMAELGELLERAWLLGHDIERTPLGRQLPSGGLALLRDTAQLRLDRIRIDGQDWWVDRVHGHTMSSAVVDRRVTIAGYRIAQPLFVGRYGPGPWFSWYDGLRTGYSNSLDQLPPSLLERIEEQGWMRSVAEPRRPLTDLEVRFLVRRPNLDERPRQPAASIPAGCGHPAILIPSREPVPLVDEGGRPLDVPVIADPAEALAVLGRAYNGRIYIPHAHCLDPMEISFSNRKCEWLVGVLPTCLAA